jgi:uncharacterized protein (DUF1697 family)
MIIQSANWNIRLVIPESYFHAVNSERTHTKISTDPVEQPKPPALKTDMRIGYGQGMTKYVVLLRGINVGGSHRIKMADLKSALDGAGINDPTTLLQSGNVVLESNADSSALTDIVETTIATGFGFHSDAIVRTSDQFEAVHSAHPFTPAQSDDPRMEHVMFFKKRPKNEGFDELRASYDGPEEMTLIGQELFIYYPDGSGRSNLTGKSLEKALGVPGTARNWNTVLKIRDALN